MQRVLPVGTYRLFSGPCHIADIQALTLAAIGCQLSGVMQTLFTDQPRAHKLLTEGAFPGFLFSRKRAPLACWA